MINFFSIDISLDGMIGSGGLWGTTAPTLAGLQSADLLRIYVRKVFLTASVSSTGNNTFTLPVPFGHDKVLLYVNGELYIPGVHYRVNGTVVTWLFPDYTITTSDSVYAWGPANPYTADAITFEVINLLDLTVYPGTGDVIQLKANTGTAEQFPYNENAVFLFHNKKLWSPGASFDFTLDVSDNTLTVENGVTLDENEDQMFAFYYNKRATSPFLLGESLIRLVQTGLDGITSFSLTNPQYEPLLHSSNTFLNGDRKEYKVDYNINFPQFAWIAPPAPELDPADNLDVSYFSSASQGLSIFMQSFTGALFTPSVTVQDLPTTSKRGFLFLNGACQIGPSYDNVGSPPSGYDYALSGSTLTWNGVPAMVSTYRLQWRGFKDIFSETYMRNMYYVDGTVDHPLPGIVDTSKLIVFFNTQALFESNSEFEITEPTSGNFAVEIQGQTLEVTDKIVMLYFTQLSYANLWKFHKIPSGTWAADTSKTLPTAAKNKESCFLFLNGFLQEWDYDFSLDPTGSIITYLDTANHGSLSGSDKINIVYL